MRRRRPAVVQAHAPCLQHSNLLPPFAAPELSAPVALFFGDQVRKPRLPGRWCCLRSLALFCQPSMLMARVPSKVGATCRHASPECVFWARFSPPCCIVVVWLWLVCGCSFPVEDAKSPSSRVRCCCETMEIHYLLDSFVPTPSWRRSLGLALVDFCILSLHV